MFFATDTSVLTAHSPSLSLFTPSSCSESLASPRGEKRYCTNEWLPSHCQTAVVEKLDWVSRALSWGSCGQECECCWYQHTRLWRLDTHCFLPERICRGAGWGAYEMDDEWQINFCWITVYRMRLTTYQLRLNTCSNSVHES